ncbi:hypothetical protein ACLOJK_027335 [Asimina triloba]
MSVRQRGGRQQQRSVVTAVTDDGFRPDLRYCTIGDKRHGFFRLDMRIDDSHDRSDGAELDGAIEFCRTGDDVGFSTTLGDLSAAARPDEQACRRFEA